MERQEKRLLPLRSEPNASAKGFRGRLLPLRHETLLGGIVLIVVGLSSSLFLNPVLGMVLAIFP